MMARTTPIGLADGRTSDGSRFQSVPSPRSAYAEGVTNDGRRDELQDAALHQEIELVGELVVAATSSSGHLSLAEIDALLGVRAQTPGTPRQE